MRRQVLGWSLASLLLCIMQFGCYTAALHTSQDSIAKYSDLPWNGTNVNPDVSPLNVIYGQRKQTGTVHSPRLAIRNKQNMASQAGVESLRSKYANTQRRFHVDDVKLRNGKLADDAVTGSVSLKQGAGVRRKHERLENISSKRAARVAARGEKRRFKREQVEPQPQQFILEIPNVNDSGFVANQNQNVNGNQVLQNNNGESNTNLHQRFNENPVNHRFEEQDGHRRYFEGPQNEGSNPEFQSEFRYPNSEFRRDQYIDSDFVNPDNRNFDEQQQQQQQQPHNINTDAIQPNYESTSEPQDGQYSQSGHHGNTEHDFRSTLPKSGESNLQEDIVKSENNQENQGHLDYQRSIFPNLNLLNNRQPLFPQNNYGGNANGQYNQILQNNMGNSQVNTPYGHNAFGNAPNVGNSYQNHQTYAGAQYPVQTNNYNVNSPLQKLQDRLQKSDMKLQSFLQNIKNKDCPQLPCIPQYGNNPPQYQPVPQYPNNQPPQYAQNYNPQPNTVYNPQQNYGYNPQHNYGYNPQQNIGYPPDLYPSINQQDHVYNPHQYAGLNQQQNPGYIPQQNTGYNPGGLLNPGGVIQPNGLQLPSLLHPGLGALFPHNPYGNQARMAGEDEAEDSNDQEPEGVAEAKARKAKEKASRKDCDESKTDKFRAATEEEDEETDPCAKVNKDKGKPDGEKFRAVPDSTEDQPPDVTTESPTSEFINGQFVSSNRYALKPKNAKGQSMPTNVRIGEFVDGQWIFTTVEATTETSIGQGRSAIGDEENEITSNEGNDDDQYFPDDSTNTKSTFEKVSNMNPFSKFEMNVFNIHPVKDASKSSAAANPSEAVQSKAGPSARMSNNDHTIEDKEEDKADKDPQRGSDNALMQPGSDMLQLPLPGPLRIPDFLQRRRQVVDDTIRKINEDRESRLAARIKALADRDNLNYNPMGRNAGNSNALHDNTVNTFPGVFRNVLIPPQMPLWSPVDTRPMQGNLQERRNQNKDKLLGASFEKGSQETKDPCRRSYNGTITSGEICELEKSKRDLTAGNNSTDDARAVTDVEETHSNIAANGTKSQRTELETKNVQATEIDANKPGVLNAGFMSWLNSVMNRNAENETESGNETTPGTNTTWDTTKANTSSTNDSTTSPSTPVLGSERNADDSTTKETQQENVNVTTDAEVVNASTTLSPDVTTNITNANEDILNESPTNSSVNPDQYVTGSKVMNESDSESISEISNTIDVLGGVTTELVTTTEVIDVKARLANSSESVNETSSIGSSSSEDKVLNETISDGEEMNNNKTALTANGSAERITDQNTTLKTMAEADSIKNKTLDNVVISSDLEILNNKTSASEESIVSSKRSVKNIVTIEKKSINDTSSNSTTSEKGNDSIITNTEESLNNSTLTDREELSSSLQSSSEDYDLRIIDLIDKTSDEEPSSNKPSAKDYDSKSANFSSPTVAASQGVDSQLTTVSDIPVTSETKITNKSSFRRNQRVKMLESNSSSTEIVTPDKNTTQSTDQNNRSDIVSAAVKQEPISLDSNNMSNLTEKEKESTADENFRARNNILDISDSNMSVKNDSSLITIVDNETVTSEINATQQNTTTTDETEVDANLITEVMSGELQETNTTETTPTQVDGVTIETTVTSEAEGKTEITPGEPIDKSERSANVPKNINEIPTMNLNNATEITPANETDTTELRTAELKNTTEIPQMELNTTTEITTDEIKNITEIADELKITTEILPGEMENQSKISTDNLRSASEIKDVSNNVTEINSSEPADVTEIATSEQTETTEIAQDETTNTTVTNATETTLDVLKTTTATVELNDTESTTENVTENICQKHIREMTESELLEMENINPSFQMSKEFVKKIIKQMREKYPEVCDESNISTEILEYSVKSINKLFESIVKPELETVNKS